MKLTLFHGSRNAREVAVGGFDWGRLQQTDPGDFGRGLYLTRIRPRAQSYGEIVWVTVSLHNPLVFETPTQAYDAVDQMLGGLSPTVRGTPAVRREAAARFALLVRQLGHDSIVVHHPEFGRYWEVVAFGPEIVEEVWCPNE